MGPKEHMAAIGRKHENIWHRVDDLRETKGKTNPDWPAWCFLPLQYWHEIILKNEKSAGTVYELAAVGTWRYTQGIYRFDNSVYNALINTSHAKDIPTEVFHRLPEWCVYIETQEIQFPDDIATGFWAHLDYDLATGNHHLHLLINCERRLIPIRIPIGDWTISRTHREILIYTGDSSVFLTTEVPVVIYNLVSLLLFICLDNPDIESNSRPGSLPERPRPTRTKAGWKLYAPTNPRTWIIGKNVGKDLQRDEWAKTPQGTSYLTPTLIKNGSWEGNWKEMEDGKKRYQYWWNSPKSVNK